MKHNQLRFFIPVYFDVESFLILREKILTCLSNTMETKFHILDDSAGSDPAIASLKDYQDIIVTSMPYNLGHQRALVYGLRRFLQTEPSDALIITMDSDGEDRPEDLPALLAAFETSSGHCFSIVLAKRTQRKESLFFKMFYLFYKNIFRLLTGTVIQTGNYAVTHSSLLRKIIFHPYFDLAFASTLFSLGTELKFVPCPRGLRYRGQSKMNFSRLAIHGIRMFMPFVDKIAIRGVLAFSLFLLLSVLCSIGLAVAHITGIFPVPNWILVAMILVFVMSFLSLCSFALLITVFAGVQGLAFSRLENPFLGIPSPESSKLK